MRISTAVGLFLFTLLRAADAGADPFVFNAALTTRGIFTCVPSVACSGSGTSTVTLGSGANMATLRFTGVDTTIQIDNTASHVALGSIHASSSSGFTFPTRPNRNVPILGFTFSITHASATHTKGWGFGPGGGVGLPLLTGSTHTIFPTGSADFPAIVYTFRTSPAGFIIPSHGRLDIGADVGAVPEPASLLLVGAGLAGAFARRKRSPAAG